MTAELNAIGALAGNVAKTTKPHKLTRPKKKAKKKEEAPEAKTPSAADVRAALSEGEITPLEAADLNPKGGLKPKASDVREAYLGGHISYEEATDLNYYANLNPSSPSKAKSSSNSSNSSKAKSSTNSSKAKSSTTSVNEGPINVSSERVYPTGNGLQPRTAINAGRQWDNVV